MDWSNHIRIKKSGGILDDTIITDIDDQILADAKQLFNNLQERLLADNYTDSLNDIELILINSTAISAFVIKGDDTHAICLSIGSIRAVWNLLLLSLADPETFPNYPGDDKINYESESEITRDILLGPAIIPSLHYSHDKERPKKYQNITAERLEVVSLLFNSIMEYILYHEAMHITRRHLPYFSILNNETYIDEEVVKGRTARIYQLFEVDADITALGYNIISHPEFKERETLNEHDRKDFFLSEMFCYILVQQLFDLNTQTEMETQLKGYHPPPVFRAMFFSNLLRKHFSIYSILSEEDIIDQQDKAWYEASRIAAKLGFPEGRWHGSHMNDVPFDLINDWIDDFNSFQDIIDIEDDKESFKRFRNYIHL